MNKRDCLNYILNTLNSFCDIIDSPCRLSIGSNSLTDRWHGKLEAYNIKNETKLLINVYSDGFFRIEVIENDEIKTRPKWFI